jgi:hypothetical protein
MELKEIMQKEAFQENVSFTVFFDFCFLNFGFSAKAKKIKRKAKYTKPITQ